MPAVESMADFNNSCITAEELQQYFEQLCAMDEKELRELWENSEVYAKLKKIKDNLFGVHEKAALVVHAHWI